MAKMNEMVGMNNYLLISGLKKRLHLVRHFTRKEFCKCIGCILSVITYGKRRHKIWSEIQRTVVKNLPTKLHRDVRGNTDIHKVCCDIYFTYYCYACH